MIRFVWSRRDRQRKAIPIWQGGGREGRDRASRRRRRPRRWRRRRRRRRRGAVVVEKGIVHITRVRRVLSHRSHRPPPRTESHRYLGAGEHEPAIRSSTIVGLLVGNAHGERAQSLDESRPQVDLEGAGGRRQETTAAVRDDRGGKGRRRHLRGCA